MSQPTDGLLLTGPRPDLYHFSCSHTFEAMGRWGVLRPLVDLAPPEMLEPLDDIARVMASFVWLTADPNPTKRAIGLDNPAFECDRMAHRYRVSRKSGHTCVSWESVSQQWPPHLVATLRKSPLKPSTWWLSPRPVPVIHDPPRSSLVTARQVPSTG